MTSSNNDGEFTSIFSKWPIHSYLPRHPQWPYSPQDFTRDDESSDCRFYSQPRFVTHIDDNAISCLREYYDVVLPKEGAILDFCSSWISHYPVLLQHAQERGEVKIIGVGLNKQELERNVLLPDPTQRIVQDLNERPDLGIALIVAGGKGQRLDAATCVVSVDYLIQPLEVLKSIRSHMKPNGMIHVAISNRAFWNKVIRRWKQVDEEERLMMVADYLHFAGFEGIEIVDIVGEKENRVQANRFKSVFGMVENDPLWVVRGRNLE
jgi:hypothetical protein